MAPPAVKICGLTRPEDARWAARAGARYLGAVLVESSPRCVTPQAAGALGRAGGRPLVLVVAGWSPERVVEAWREASAAGVQLHGDEGPEFVEALRGAGVKEIWKAFRVREPDETREAMAPFLPLVDGVVWDGWHKDLLGGSGVRFPWARFRALRDDLPPAVALVAAGGLKPGNVGAAVRALRPHVVDVSSGVESRPGLKDPDAVERFIQEAVDV